MKKILKTIVYLSYINEETLGSSNNDRFIAICCMLYYCIFSHFILYVLNLNGLYNLTSSKIFILIFFLVMMCIPLFIAFFLYNDHWTNIYYNELYKLKISKNKMWIQTLIFMSFPIIYFFVTLYLLKIPRHF
jgi:hypothetical protein